VALRREPPLIARFPFPLLRFSFSRRRVIFNFSEVAQRRRRVFVVASARDDFYPAAVLFEFDGVRRDIAPGTEQTIMPTLPGAGKLRRHGEKKDDAKDKQTANSQKNYAKLRKKTANSESVKREKLIDAYRLAGANAKGLQRL
jgi:site-specific DNA-cytosine methylase